MVIPALLIIAVCLFGITAVVTRAYGLRRQALARQWFDRGQKAMQASNPNEAVANYRTALSYSEGNPQYSLRLAEALAAANRTDEALAYFLNLWDREPGNGLLNLEIARLQVRVRNVPNALRYFHGAIDGRWDQDADAHRREARLELIDFLIQNREINQAQSELIALSGNLPADAQLRSHVAQLFLKTDAYARALSEAREALRIDRHNQTALATAGDAAFHLKQYTTARSFLKAAAAANPQDTHSNDLLQTAELILTLDPFQPHLRSSEQSQRVLQAFDAAGKRLQWCAELKGMALDGGQSNLDAAYMSWANLQPQMRLRTLQRDSDLRDSAMDAVFQIERVTDQECGTPTGVDLALLLIAQDHETAER